ncbi:MAG: hypothetical protein QM500_04220 [Methylococcales bacterium]
MNIKTTDIINRKNIFLWIAVATGILLLIPYIAMQFTNEVNWEIGDFIVMSFLLFSTGSLFVLISRKTNQKHRVVLGAILVIVFLYVWAELAVGIFFGLGS